MRTAFATALLTATLAAATLPAQAAGWGDALRDGASKLGSGSGSAASEGSSSGLGGLLGGLTVSAPRPAVKMLNAMAPHVTFVDRRWSRDGKVWTSSTLLNGTDMMRAFATETWGGRTGFVEASLDMGAWPARDVDFKDFKGYHFEAEAPPGFGV